MKKQFAVIGLGRFGGSLVEEFGHRKLLNKIEVDRVFHPERDIAKRIAHHLISEKVIDYIELSDNLGENQDIHRFETDGV